MELTAPEALRVPDFFVVGHPKSGTTALYEMLRSHPQIYMPDLKEPRFFAPDFGRRSRGSATGRLPGTLEQYLSLFEAARPGQRAGEATPLYLMSRAAAGLISEAQPAARIVAILREPASFLRSFHLQLVQAQLETEKDLRTALSLEDARREGRRLPRRLLRPQMLLYSEHVRYVEQLRRYYARFSPDQVLVLVYDDYRLDNDATVRKVLRFLDVDDTAAIGTSEVNPTVTVRSVRMDRLVHAVSYGRGPASRAVKAAVKAVAPREVRHRALRTAERRVLWSDPGEPDDRLMRELRRRFKPEVLALGEVLGRDLVSLWGYGDLG